MGICCISLTSFNFEKFCHMGNILHNLFKSVLFCCRLMNFRTSYWMCINSVLNCWSIFSSFCSNKGSTWFYIVIYIYNIRICACIIHTVALNISTTTSVDWSNVKESIWSICILHELFHMCPIYIEIKYQPRRQTSPSLSLLDEQTILVDKKVKI